MGIFNFKKKTPDASAERPLEPDQKLAFEYMSVRELKDAPRRLELMLKYAERGVPLALYETGEAYLFGKGVPRDEEKGEQYLVRAGKRGASGAITTLAQYHIGLAFEELSEQRVAARGKQACMEEFYKKYGRGADELAWALSLGSNSAMDTYTGAVRLGWNEGSLAQTLHSATDAAFKMYEQELICRGTPEDGYVLGMLALRGIAVPQDIAAAKEYFEKSAAMGNDKAKKELENPLLTLAGMEDDEY